MSAMVIFFFFFSLSENQFDPQGSKAFCEGLISMKALKILQ